VQRATGILLLSVWAEPGDGFRFRVTSTTDSSSDERSTSYTVERAEALALVRSWLDEVAPGA
jgi:hypothetical protein